MGNLIHKTGDFLLARAGVFAHGCNCRGGFGSGVAGQIARKHPEVREAYLRKHNGDGWKLGDVQFVEADGRVFCNMATQDSYGGPEVHVSYDAVGACFDKLLGNAESNGWTVSIPKVGAGLAGGSWAVIEAVIAERLSKYDVTVEVYTFE